MVFREQKKKEAAEQYKLSTLENADLHVNYEEDNYDAGERDAIEQFAPKAFIAGAEWADEHPKELDGCKFCKQEEVVIHKSKECDLSYDGDTLCADVDIPLTWGSATGYYGFTINYCPMCGRKLSK